MTAQCALGGLSTASHILDPSPPTLGYFCCIKPLERHLQANVFFFPSKFRAIRFLFHIISVYSAESPHWTCQLRSIIPGADFTRQKSLGADVSVDWKKEEKK